MTYDWKCLVCKTSNLAKHSQCKKCKSASSLNSDELKIRKRIYLGRPATNLTSKGSSRIEDFRKFEQLMFFTLGTLSLIWGIFSGADLALHGENAAGEVISYERGGSKYSRGGPTHWHTLKVGEKNLKVILDAQVPLGTTVNLRYIPNRPNSYAIDGEWSGPRTFVIGSFVLFFIGLLCKLNAKKTSK